VYVGPTILNSDGRSFIMPSHVEDASLVIAFNVFANTIHGFF
jgi:hypothetical protein